MLGVLSFLMFLCWIAFPVSVIMIVFRLVKKKPCKPFAIAAFVSVIGVLALSVPISRLYVPAEKQDNSGTSSVVESTANVDSSVDSVDNHPSESEIPSIPEQSVAPAATPEPEPAPPETSTATPKPESARPGLSTATPEQSVAPEATSEPESAPSETSTATPKPKTAPPEPSTEPKSSDEPVPSRTTESPAETEEPESSAAPSASIAKTYKVGVIVASRMTLDRFIFGYSVSLAEQNWTVADFDSKGAVIAMADVKFKSSKEIARAILVLTPKIVDGKMTEAKPHFVAVGDKVYGNDGYCDDVFSSLQEALDSLGDSE